jgi:omega-6 fatty acid desaturase (delta-12 desaturase)
VLDQRDGKRLVRLAPARRIPGYRLREALADHPELRDLGRLTLRQSLECFRLALWDGQSRRLVAFRDLRMRA